jgi:hypothetical protein
MEYENINHAYLGKSTERAMGRGEVRWVAQCITDLICESSNLCHMYNSSHN